MKKGSKIINFFVGILTLTLISFFYGIFNSIDGISALYQFALISIICTMGVTLVIWIPVVLLLGTVVTKIFGLFFNKKSQQLSENTPSQSIGKSIQDSPSNNELAVVGYIVSSRHAGIMDDVAIRLNLKSSGGWSDTDIDNAFKKCTPRT